MGTNCFFFYSVMDSLGTQKKKRLRNTNNIKVFVSMKNNGLENIFGEQMKT